MKCDFAGGDERIFEGPRVVIYLLERPRVMIYLTVAVDILPFSAYTK